MRGHRQDVRRNNGSIERKKGEKNASPHLKLHNTILLGVMDLGLSASSSSLMPSQFN
jgi:hypothetical protein